MEGMTSTANIAVFARPVMPIVRRGGQKLITEKKPQKKKK